MGSSLALRLREAYPSAGIICLDNLYRKGSELNRRRVEDEGVFFVKGDVRDRAAFDMEPCDLIVDAAAEPSVMAGKEGDDAAYVVDTNLGGTLNVLEAARKWSSMLIFLSTSRVYPVDMLRAIVTEEHATRLKIAETQDLPGITSRGIAEEFPLAGARTLYGATKYASEIMALEYASHFGLRVIINRCGVLAGPWQMGRVDQGVVALWVAAHHYGRPLSYIGYNGKQVRDVLHVEDLADLLLLQLEGEVPWKGQVYNVGGGRPASFSLRELTEVTREITGGDLAIKTEEKVREGDVPLYITDSSRVEEAFRWKPKRSTMDIVADTARWIGDHEDDLREVFLG